MNEIVDSKVESRIASVLAQTESRHFECKRVSGKMVGKALETICAFANTAGGILALGLEDASNREMSATEIAELSYQRGFISAESEPVPVPFDLLATDIWRLFAASRGFLSGDLPDQMFRIGLAKRVMGEMQPVRAAVLLFADEPGGLLAAQQTRADVRVFHYLGNRIEPGAVPNLLKPPKTLSGALPVQIARASAYVLDELASGLTLAASGFKTVHRYPERVIKEAITNAVIHRDYRLNRDIHIRIFDNRIEIDGPGLFPGVITPSNIARAGSFARNPLIARNLREFPEPPNVDAGEGVRMMFAEMRAANLFPPRYSENRDTAQSSVIVTLNNEARPPIWEQVSDWMDRNGSLSNSNLCQIASMDTLKASKVLKRWVENGLLLRDDSAGKRHTFYRKPVQDGGTENPFPLSFALDNEFEK